jgi:hypothetical protein
MKKNAANAYSTNGLIQMESWIEPVTERLVRKLRRQAGQPVDIACLLKDYAMDAVFAVTFGRDFNYVEEGDVLKMYGVLETVSDYMAVVSILSAVWMYCSPSDHNDSNLSAGLDRTGTLDAQIPLGTALGGSTCVWRRRR